MQLLSIFIFTPHTELNHLRSKPGLFLPLSDGHKGYPKVTGRAQKSTMVVNDVEVRATHSCNLLVSSGPAMPDSGLATSTLQRL